MTRTEFGIERVSCGCEKCRAFCTFMPGVLLPSDLLRLLPCFVDPLEWAEENLLASPGAIAVQGINVFRIPTLVPKTKEDGSCIHLRPDGLCGIHDKAPFGCAFFGCGAPHENWIADKGMMTILEDIRKPDSLYLTVWAHLALKGLTQQGPEILRQKRRVK